MIQNTAAIILVHGKRVTFMRPVTAILKSRSHTVGNKIRAYTDNCTDAETTS